MDCYWKALADAVNATTRALAPKQGHWLSLRHFLPKSLSFINGCIAPSKVIRPGQKQPPVLGIAFPNDYDSLIEGKQQGLFLLPLINKS